MKTKNLLLMAALAGVVFTGCSNDESDAPAANVLPADNVIRMEASVNHMQTRAVGYSADGLSELGLFVTNGVNSAYTYNNVCMKKENSVWNSYGSDGTTAMQMLWQNSTTAVSVTAYAPYVADVTQGGTLTGTVETDQTTEANGQKSDVLYANSSVTPNAPEIDSDIYYDTTTKKLNVRMNHALSKLTVNIRYGTELTQESGTPVLESVTLGGTNIGYTLDLSSGSINEGTATDDVQDIQMAAGTASNGYAECREAILVPQTTAFSITVVIDGRTFVYNNASYPFVSGNAYILNLVVGKDIVNVGEITTSQWTTNPSGTLETE